MPDIAAAAPVSEDKPTVFIGSSSESQHLAEAVQQRLGNVAQCVCWSDPDVFKLNRSVLEWLLNATEAFDFGLFIFAPDDMLTVGDQKFRSVRDNVVFEFGLFLGAKDRTRVFALGPREPDESPRGLRQLLDLYGIGFTPYEVENVVSAIGNACEPIEKAVKNWQADRTRRRLSEARQAAAAESATDAAERPLLKERPMSLLGVNRDLKHVRKDFEELSQLVSTQYLGRFPDFFETHIIPRLEKTVATFHVACDLPAYGSFSAKEAHDRYFNALKTAHRRGVVIEAAFMSEARRREITRLQMPTDWKTAMADATFAKKIEAFAPEISSVAELEQRLNQLHEWRLSALKNPKDPIAATCAEVESAMPIYLWIADSGVAERECAVFSIPQFGSPPSEHGFFTTDPRLVKPLRALWERYVKGW